MHMSDALLSPAVGATCWAAAATAIGHSSRRVRAQLDEAKVPLMGVLSAFVFATQMVNFSVPGTGSSGHLSGGLLLAIFLGPYRGFLAIASVLVVQCLFFADGGLLALGANILNMGFFACFLVYPLVWKPLAAGHIGARQLVGTVLAAVLILEAGAFGVVVETTLSGISDLQFSTFLLFMLPIHLAIGLVEGLVTAGILVFVRQTRPELLGEVGAGPGPRTASVVAVLVVALAVGGLLSWYASEDPDGLEWSLGRVLGPAPPPADEGGVHGLLARVQERLAFLPDYGFRSPEGGRAGTTASGAVGVGLVLVLAGGLGLLARARRRPPPGS